LLFLSSKSVIFIKVLLPFQRTIVSLYPVVTQDTRHCLQQRAIIMAP